MAIDVGEALTRKLGPLPAWGWGVAIGGGLLVWRFVSGPSEGGEEADPDQVPTFVGGPQIPSDLLTDISVTLRGIEENTKPTMDNTPTGGGNGTPTEPPPSSEPTGKLATSRELQERLFRTLGGHEARRAFARRHKREGDTLAESWTRLFGERGWGFKQLTGTAPKPPTPYRLRRLIQEARAQ